MRWIMAACAAVAALPWVAIIVLAIHSERWRDD